MRGGLGFKGLPDGGDIFEPGGGGRVGGCGFAESGGCQTGFAQLADRRGQSFRVAGARPELVDLEVAEPAFEDG